MQNFFFSCKAMSDKENFKPNKAISVCLKLVAISFCWPGQETALVVISSRKLNDIIEI